MKNLYAFKPFAIITLIVLTILNTNCGKITYSPEVTTSNVGSITATGAVSGGTIVDDGGAEIIRKGICWNTSPSPTIENNNTNNGEGAEAFTSTLTGLTAGTTYYVRAYAENSVGISYGNELIFTTPLPQIGSSYQGGILAYIFQPGDFGYVPNAFHGIISAPHDIFDPLYSFWGCSGNSVGSTSGNIGKGKDNTTLILYVCNSPGVAAYQCDNYSINGYDDWFLPSLSELYVLRGNLYLNGNIANFNASDCYWTSTEVSSVSAYRFCFSTGLGSVDTKYISYRVRPIRYF